MAYLEVISVSLIKTLCLLVCTFFSFNKKKIFISAVCKEEPVSLPKEKNKIFNLNKKNEQDKHVYNIFFFFRK